MCTDAFSNSDAGRYFLFKLNVNYCLSCDINFCYQLGVNNNQYRSKLSNLYIAYNSCKLRTQLISTYLIQFT